MVLDPIQFFHACDPSRTLRVGDADDHKYYIDFASVRGGNIIKRLERTILNRSKLSRPTCQLFTGHIGCGKSTELRRLQAQLTNQGFHVVYFESTQDLDMANVDISDILLAIARQISRNLEAVNVQLQPNRFKHLLAEAWELLNSEVTGLRVKVPELQVEGAGAKASIKAPTDIGLSAADGQYSLSFGIGELTSTARNSEGVRSLLRQHLEPRVNRILEVINTEVLAAAKQRLQKDLVVIVDNLDRIDNRQKEGSTRTLPEYLFVDRGDQLRQLDCHIIYTIPLVLAFSNEFEALKNRLGGGNDVKRLPMVPTCNWNGTDNQEGMTLLRQLVLARAFPNVEPEERLGLVSQVFDHPDTLDRLCQISGGHIRNLLSILHRCLEEDDPPITKHCVERAIREHRDSLSLAITEEEWSLIQYVEQHKQVSGEDNYKTLLRSLFVFEYDDPTEGRWFQMNPALRETKQFKAAQANKG